MKIQPQTKLGKEFFSKGLSCCALLFLFSSSSFAQWNKIFDAGISIRGVYFKNTTAVPLDGFVYCYSSGSRQSQLWRTLDGGLSWKRIVFLSPEPTIWNLVFKDSLNGWFSSGQSGRIYQTKDGGWNWTLCPSSKGTTGCAYAQSTNMLISAVTSPSFSNIYSNDGTNFTNGNLIIKGTISVTFSDGLHGIMSSSSFYSYKEMAFTSDGGITWMAGNDPNSVGEFCQPVGIQGTKTFFAICESSGNISSGKVIRSDDGGQTWKTVYRYSSLLDFQETGVVQYGTGISLFFQTTQNGSEGIMMSDDSGITFHSICGPINDFDTRFYVRDTFIYAGDKYGGLWLNTTGIGSNSTPQLSLSSVIFPKGNCTLKSDSLITFTFFDSCNNIQAKLLSASISGSSNFSFSSASAIPRTIHPDDSLTISYNPVSSKPDTAALHLKFHLGWKDFDTTIQLFGSGRIPKESIRFLPSAPLYSAHAGNMVDLVYLPDKNISARGLDSISFDLTLNGDILDYRGVSTSIPGATISLTALSPAPLPEYRARVIIRGANMALDSLVPVADIQFQAMVAKEMKTPITMTNVMLNGGDADYKNCVLSADTANTSFDLVAQCGDLTLSRYLNGILPLDIISIRPNPAQDEVVIDVINPLGHMQCAPTVFDALGAKVYSEIRNIPSGQSSIHLPIHDLAPGVYFVRVGDVGRSFVKMK
jgi:hypothetical protein